MDFLQVLTEHTHQLVFSGAVIFGMIGHYCKKKIKSETNITFVQWFGTVHLFGTIASMSTAALTIFGALSNNLITPDMDIVNLIYVGLTTGYAVDSVTNGDSTT